MVGNNWPDHMRAGIAAILQNRVGTVLVLLLHVSFKLPTILHAWRLGNLCVPGQM